MLNISTTNSSLRSSLRSSSAKRSLNSDIVKIGSSSKNEKVHSNIVLNDEDTVKDTTKSNELSVLNNSEHLNEIPKEMNSQDIQDTKCTLIPLSITTPEKSISDPLLSPSNLSLISPTSNSNVPKKKKKLNDCIAMLTGKIQEKLGVNFFESPVPKTEQMSPLKASAVDPCSLSVATLEMTPCDHHEQQASEIKPSTSFQIASLLKETAVTGTPIADEVIKIASIESEFTSPVQDEVIDLSIKKKPAVNNSDPLEVFKREKTVLTVDIEPKEESPSSEIKKVINETKEVPLLPSQCESNLESTSRQLELEEEKKDETEPNSLLETEEVFSTIINGSVEADTPKSFCPKHEETPIPHEISTSENANPQEISTSEKACDSESLKISIPKERITNLKQILDQYQVITVNNIKISESERRAFEEQKNRILKILNKTNSLTRKITNRKTNSKKAVKRKATTKRPPPQRNAKKTEIVKPKPESPENNESELKTGNVEAKIEEVIKTTNRIRCRRLSVVVDPIINLSAYQNKNRKIRLTNNSQQNGFYDLLAASEQFFSDNKIILPTTPEETAEKVNVKIDEVKPEHNNDSLSQEGSCLPRENNEVIKDIVSTKTRQAKSNASKEISKIVCPLNKESHVNKSDNILSPNFKAKMPVKLLTSDATVSEEADNQANAKQYQENSLEEKIHASNKKGRGKKQNVENIASPEFVLEPSENVDFKVIKETEKSICDRPKNKQRKPPMKRGKKSAFPLEEIKVEQRVEVVNVMEQADRRKKITQEKQASEENLLDISFSSDTSNENDIPLAKLIPSAGKIKIAIDLTPAETDIIEKIDHPIIIIKEKDERLEQKIVSVEGILENQKEPSLTPIDPVDKISQEGQKPTIENLDEDRQTSAEKLQPFLSETSSTNDLAAIPENDAKKPFDPFIINEDSFFNDDLDNDPSDKINDIVNNIINSSEFQIDSDTEKSEVYQENGKEQIVDRKRKLLSCVVCKRTFRTEKVLEKHCTTSTHIMKLQRKHRGIARTKEKEIIIQEPDVVAKESPSSTLDETKVFRTKGALKTFDHILDLPAKSESENEKTEAIKIIEPSVTTEVLSEIDLSRDQKLLNANDDKLYYEFKMEKKPEDMTPKDKDQLFDSLFNSLEAKAQGNELSYTSKLNFTIATPLDSEIESSSTSWDLKHDADLEWEIGNTDNVPFANAIKERYPKKFPVKINKSKDTAVSIPTKCLIMGKIFKKHRDSEKQKTPQADAPNNKPGIKNSLDEIFDHLKNSAEIDDKVLTCPSPKTLLKTTGGAFPPNSSHPNDMLETASHSNNNNNIYKNKIINTTPEKEIKVPKVINIFEPQLLNDSLIVDGEDGIGTRKSRRRCAIQSKTFAETWSSDEYEELHDTEDIISIINEIEKRESIKKRKMQKHELDVSKKAELANVAKLSLARRSAEPLIEKKKSVQIQFSDETLKPEKSSNSIKKRRTSASKDGHKSDEEAFTATKDFKPLKPGLSIKKRRMSCFVPSTTSFDERPKLKPTVAKPITDFFATETEEMNRLEKINDLHDVKSKSKKSDSEKSFKNQKRFVNLMGNFGGQQATKKKAQKHRKRPRNKVKNIAYDSDSDFELNLSRKSKVSTFSESSSSEEDEDEDNVDTIITPKTNKSQTITNPSRSSNTYDMTMIKEPKLLPNDLKHVVTTATTFKAAIPEDIVDSSQNACNRTKRHSSEKLYYWSSSSESDQEQGDTADGDNEDSVMPHQPEQHGWIVGDSHKKLVTLLAHAKIKNKIN